MAAFRLISVVRSVLDSWVTLQNALHTITVAEEGISKGAQPDAANEVPFIFKHSIELHNSVLLFQAGICFSVI